MTTLTAYNRVIIYSKPGADPVKDRIVTEGAGCRTTLVPADLAETVAVAIQAVEEGADRIELCGGMGLLPYAAVFEAVAHRVPVGAVMFGFESLAGVADYQARYGKEFLHEAFLYRQPGADPAVDRTVREDEHARTRFIPVPDAAAAATVAAQLIDGEGVRLLELYGFGPVEAARVIDTIDARAPVGIPSYPAH